jgi:hypothetical protein
MFCVTLIQGRLCGVCYRLKIERHISCYFLLGRFAYEFQVHDWTPADRTNPAYVARCPWAGGTADLVVDMAKRLEGRAHTIICDNYFTSAKAFRALRGLGFHAVGTLKSRSGVPKQLLWKKKQTGRPSGAAHFLRSTDGQLLVQEWQDSGLVRVMSTGHVGYGGLGPTYTGKPGVEVVERWRKGVTNWERANFPCPPAVVFYQQNMRGVDMCDAVCKLRIVLPIDSLFSPQKRAVYTVRQKGNRWYMSIFYFFVDVALVNSFIIFQRMMGSWDMTDQLAFRCSLIDSLLSLALALEWGPERRLPASGEIRSYQSRKQPLPDARFVGMHLPEASDKQARCALCYYVQRKNADGSVSIGTPKTRCMTCGVHLCIVQGRNCFAEYHTPEE